MKYIFFSACAVLCGMRVVAQKIVLQDDFSGNTNNWSLQTSGNNRFQLVEGKYVLEGLSDSTKFAAVPVAFDSAKNYSISVTATHLGGVDNYEFGIHVGSADGKNACRFVISPIGFYKFYGYVNGQYKQFYDWTAFLGLKKGSNVENKMTLNKVGGDWVMYLNGQWVASVPLRFDFAGLQVGFIRSNKQKVAFDDLTITEIMQ